MGASAVEPMPLSILMMSASNVARNIAMVNRYWYHRLSVHKICGKGVAYKAKS